MSLKTPDKIRTFQRKLYFKAKAKPDFRFYLLYDKIYREDILRHAYRLAKSNGGGAGVDGVTFEMVESKGLDEWLSGIREELKAKTYKPQLVRRVMIPKPGGGYRPLGIPSIRDRVIQISGQLKRPFQMPVCESFLIIRAMVHLGYFTRRSIISNEISTGI